MSSDAGKKRRKDDLAKIHIARKELAIDEDSYRQIIRDIGGADSGSSADLDMAGRRRVLQHFRDKGWRSKVKGKRAPAKAASGKTIMASDRQVCLIRCIWISLSHAGIVKDGGEQALRTWIRSMTRRYHPQHVGYSAPEFLPHRVAVVVIENLKKWAERCDVKW